MRRKINAISSPFTEIFNNRFDCTSLDDAYRKLSIFLNSATGSLIFSSWFSFIREKN